MKQNEIFEYNDIKYQFKEGTYCHECCFNTDNDSNYCECPINFPSCEYGGFIKLEK